MRFPGTDPLQMCIRDRVSVDNQRQHLPDALQPEVFLHLTESLAQTVTRIRVPRNRRLDKPLLLMHITSGLAGDALNTCLLYTSRCV